MTQKECQILHTQIITNPTHTISHQIQITGTLLHRSPPFTSRVPVTQNEGHSSTSINMAGSSRPSFTPHLLYSRYHTNYPSQSKAGSERVLSFYPPFSRIS